MPEEPPAESPTNQPLRKSQLAAELAREIKRRRLEAGLSQRVLATRIGYSRQYVSMTEWHDANLPSHELITAIDSALNASGELIALRKQASQNRRDTSQPSNSLPSVSDSGHGIIALPPIERQDLPAASANAVYPCQADSADDIQMLAKRAQSVDILAVRGLGILGLNDSLLRRFIPNTAKVRAILLSPESAAAARRAEEIGESPESFSAGIVLAIARMKELADKGRSIEVYTHDRIPIWRIIRIDDVMFVSAFTVQYEGHAAPMNRIEQSKNSVLHEAFVRTLEHAVSDAQRMI